MQANLQFINIFIKTKWMKLLLTLFVGIFIFSKIVAAQNSLSAQDQSLETQGSKQKRQLDGANTTKLTFSEFKQLYNKKYSTLAEEDYRKHIFYANLRKLNEHNHNSQRKYNMKANQFLDISSRQFKEVYTRTYRSDNHSKNVSKSCLKNKQKRGNNSLDNHRRQNHRNKSSKKQSNSTISSHQQSQNIADSSNRILIEQPTAIQIQAALHKTIIIQANSTENKPQIISKPLATGLQIDWTLYAGQVKYQGFCGACYAFSSVDALASMYAIYKYGFFIPLSVQQVIECANNGLTFGCGGGYLEGALTHIQLNGIAAENSYPYTSANTGAVDKCKYMGGQFKIKSFESIEQGNCMQVINKLKVGPVAAGIAGYTLQFYDSGVFNDCDLILDHAVVIVGYRSGVGWRIKNSWGSKWGQKGYGWIQDGNTCGICNMATSINL